MTDNALAIPLTVTATCDGPSPLTASGATLLMVTGAPAPTQPGQTVELWQGTDFNSVDRVSVNPVDGSCWAMDRDPSQRQVFVYHFAADGTQVWRGAVDGHGWLAVNPADGSCWVATNPSGSNQIELIHLAQDGSHLLQGAYTHTVWSSWPMLVVNPADESCWVTSCAPCMGGETVHVAADGTVLQRQPSLGRAFAINPADGSYWIVNGSQVVHLSGRWP